jgi:hypothetical protein
MPASSSLFGKAAQIEVVTKEVQFLIVHATVIELNRTNCDVATHFG